MNDRTNFQHPAITSYRNSAKRSFCWSSLSCILFVFLLFASCHQNENWEYVPFSKAVIQIEFVNDPPDTYFVHVDESYGNYLYQISSDILKIDSSGIYYTDNEIESPTALNVSLGEDNYQVFVFPNDTGKLRIRFSDEGYRLSFHGNAKNINSYLAEKNVNFSQLNIARQCDILKYQNLEYRDYVLKLDSIVDAEVNYLQRQKSKHSLSRNFINYEMSRVKYTALQSKLDQGAENRRYDRIGRFIRSNESRPELYYEFLNQPSLNNSKAIYTEIYYDYINTLFRQLAFPKSSDYYDIPPKDRFAREMAMAKEKLKGKSRAIYQFRSFFNYARYISDPSVIDSIAATYKIKDYGHLITLAEKRNQNRLVKGGLMPVIYFSDTDYQLKSIREFEDKGLMIRLCSQRLDSTGIEDMIFEKIKEKYSHVKNLLFINIYMHVDPEQWLNSMAQDKESQSSFMVEGAWNRELTEMFEIRDLPHYLFVGKGNILYNSQDHLSLIDQEAIDSMLFYMQLSRREVE